MSDTKAEPAGQMNTEQYLFRLAGRVDTVNSGINNMKHDYEQMILTMAQTIAKLIEELAALKKTGQKG